MSDIPVKVQVSADDRPFNDVFDRILGKTRNTSRQIEMEWKRIDKVSSDLMRKSAGGGGARGQGGMGIAGGAALQIQDVAVQAQMGADPMRILVQQGTQIASLFGPAGAIIAGLGATVAVLWDAAQGAKGFGDEVKELEAINKRLDFADKTAEIQEQADIAAARAEFGDDYADAMERAAKHEKAGQEAAKQSGTVEYTRRLKAIDDLAEAEEKLAQQRKKDKYYEEVEAQTKRIGQAQQQMAEMSLTFEQRRLELIQEIGDLVKKMNTSGVTGLQYEKAKADMLEKQLELVRLTKSENEKLNNDAKKADQERQKAQDAAQDRLQAFADSQSQFWAKIISAVKTAATEAKNLKQQSVQSGLDAFNNRVQNRLKTPQERAEERREARRAQRAVRTEVRRDVEEMDKIRDRNGNVIGRRGISTAQRDAMTKARVGAINEANKKSVVDLSDATLTKMAKIFADETNKVIPH